MQKRSEAFCRSAAASIPALLAVWSEAVGLWLAQRDAETAPGSRLFRAHGETLLQILTWHRRPALSFLRNRRRSPVGTILRGRRVGPCPADEVFQQPFGNL